MVTATYKIGLNKGRRRLWIDGRRLREAGFIGGSHYRCDCRPGAIDMALDTDKPGRLRKVTGRPDGKPIVDLLGADVELAFPVAERVAVHFGDGRIEVRQLMKPARMAA